ncbi:two-component sensor histidine kinase [Azoarcus communis]|uniref:Sensor protein n=1 Tax=Parazoarcus communis SWub3 = DSM 12120 TaxID=1121029 RepID=A0A323UT71_9RHOO|nr:heavy metal sensor histidine kinase [Parazoarcus communis SWub3 = DSM 12120]PZA15587.1 two-component sensor histidine kinase [Azoarcus communis] [Parazoarcus communis SWub3 = DSM 12120]
MRPRGARSLNSWLSWWLGVLTFVGLGVVCSVVYAVTSWSFASRQLDELGKYRVLVLHLLDEHLVQGDIDQLRHKLDDFLVGHSTLSLKLTASEGGVLFLRESASRHVSASRTANFEIPSSSGLGSSAGTFKGELKLDIDADEDVLRRLAWTLLISALAGTTLVCSGGWWLVRRAFAPVRDLSERVAALAPDSLSLSLDGSDQAEELSLLVVQFNALLARVERAYQQLEGFNADVAHELRTPLATLIGETELALSRERGVAQLRDVLGSNLEELQRLAGLVNDMLFLSNADRGALARCSPVSSLAEVVSEVVEYHDAALHEAGVTVRVMGDGVGRFDLPLLRRALSNLFANATRYAERGSVMSFRIEATSRGSIRFSLSNVGPAISEEHLPRLFDRFYRVDSARQRSDANHGLGLSIVAAVARMHGGVPFAKSSHDCVTVGFELPASPP